MHILIVANGNIAKRNFYRKIIASADKVIAADGGADNCIRLGVHPDYVTGDFDSISKNSKRKFRKILINDRSQHSTDLEKAIALANKLGCSRLTVIGASGRRADHAISSIISLFKAEAPSEMIDENNTVYAVQDKISLKGRKGDIVSVIPISKVKGLTYKGLKWSVKNKNVEPPWTGTSNEMTGKTAAITLKSGKIIVIKSRD